MAACLRICLLADWGVHLPSLRGQLLFTRSAGASMRAVREIVAGE
jgi:hypothetical protein